MKKNTIEPLKIQVEKKEKKERFRKEFDLYATEVSDECPIIIQRGAVLLDTISGNKFLQLKLSNTGEPDIRSAYIKLNCFDDTGDVVGSAIDIAYSDINCTKDVCFGDKVLSSIPYVAKIFRFEEIKIAYADGTSKRFGKEFFHSIPEAKSLKATVGVEYHKFMDDQKNLRAQPEMIAENLHRCICGGLITESGKCANCGRDYQNAVYDAAHINELYTNYVEEEEREKEKERLTKKYRKHLFYSGIGACEMFMLSNLISILKLKDNTGLFHYYLAIGWSMFFLQLNIYQLA